MAASTHFTGKLEFGRLCVPNLRLIQKNPPYADSFYPLLKNKDGTSWQNSDNHWAPVEIKSHSFDPVAMIKAMNSPCNGTSFTSRLKELSEQGKVNTKTHYHHNDSFPILLLPLSFLNPEGKIQFSVGDAEFDLEVSPKFSPQEYANYEQVVKAIFQPVHFFPRNPEDKTIEAAKIEERKPAPLRVAVEVQTSGDHQFFIRGTGPGMSWDKGIELKKVNGKVVFEVPADCNEFEYKVLLDDKKWEEGSNHKATPGKTQVISPVFKS